MNRPTNVFYLPSSAPEPELIAPPTRWSILRARLVRRWWRFRIAVSEIRSVLRRPGRRSLDAEFPGLWEAAAEVSARPRRSAGPARVIEFEAARLRLRPDQPR
jgi:hypothetical protein